MADNKMEKSIKEAIGKSLNEFNKRIGMAKLIKDNKNQDRILKGILSQVNDENIEKTEKSNVITLDNSTDGIVELQEIKGDTNVNVSKIEKETPITHVIDDKNGNVISLDGITEGAINIDDIQGNTMVNCNKDTDKELILMPNLETNGYSNVTLTEGIDGGKVDVSLEGNTMVNVCDQEDPIAITKSYTVETGNHVALQGEYDGKCRPNIYGNTLVNIALAKDSYSCKNGIAQNNRINLVRNLKAGVTYTLIRTISEFSGGLIQEAINFYDMSFYIDGKQAQDHNCQYRGNGQYVSKFTPTKDVTHMDIIIGMDNIDKDNGIYPTITISDYMILEGDYTNKPIPDYFTGMKSSFEDKLVPENLNVENLWVYSTTTFNRWQLDGQLLTSTPKTLYNGSGKIIYFEMNSDIQGTQGTWLSTTPIKPGQTKLLNTPLLRSLQLKESDGWSSSLDLTGVYLVEGDYTNYDFTDYDSTKGGKYKVDYKVTGKNKFDFNKLVNKIYNQPNLNVVWDRANQQLIFSGSTDRKYVIIGEYFHTFEHGKTYTVKNYSSNSDVLIQFVISYVNPTTGNPVYIVSKNAGATFTYDKSWGEMKVYCQIDDILDNISNFTIKFQIEEGATATDYEPYKESTKTLYLNSPLLEGDTIEQSGNNIIHVHRYKEVVLDGSENNLRANGEDELTNTYRFILTDINNLKLNQNPICDKYVSTIYNSKNDYECIMIGGSRDIHFRISKNKLTDFSINAFRQYLQQNPITVVYELATPTQEIISTNDNLLLDSYTNGHLDVDTVVPIDKVEFKGNFNTSLKYLYPNTEYTIQFESDNIGKIDRLHLGGTNSDTVNVTKGINKYTITTGELSSKSIVINGIGFNASKIVVIPKVDNDFGYFKGMKSVGECEGNKIEILSRNKNLITGIKNGVVDNYGKENNHATTIIPIDYISVENGETYYFSSNFSGYKVVHEYDKDKNFIKYHAIGVSNNYCTLSSNCKYIKFRYEPSNGETLLNTQLQFEKGAVGTPYVEGKSNKKEILLNEPLRGLPNGVKDKYVIIDGKWYIERNIGVYSMANITDIIYTPVEQTNPNPSIGFWTVKGANDFYKLTKYKTNTNDNNVCNNLPSTVKYYNVWYDTDSYGLIWSDWFNNNIIGFRDKRFPTAEYKKQALNFFKTVQFNFELAQPTYEPIEYNPFEVYTDITHISNNSNIPCNMVIKNSGFNCILKPNTTYTVSSNNGLSTVTTKDSIGDSVLRFYNKDTSKITKMSNVLVLEGDYITGNPPIPAFFKGMESAFEQELVTDENNEYYGKYKVNVKAVGKNLFDKNDNWIKGKYLDAYDEIKNSDGAYYNPRYLKVIPNETYYFKRKDGSSMNISYLILYDESKHYINRMVDATSITIPNNVHYIRVTIWDVNIGSNGNIDDNYIGIGNIYEPYKENNITFYINEPLRGVGDIKDKVHVKEDKVVVERNCASVTFDGSDTWNLNKIENNIYTYSIRSTKFLIKMKVGAWEALMNNKCYIIDKCGTATTSTPKNEQLLIHNTIEDKFIWYSTQLLSTVQSVKQYLNNNPLTIIYATSTPIYEEVEYSNNRLTLNTYNNSTLFYNSNIPISNTSFKPLWEELIYIKNSTTYYIQFNAVGNGNVVVNLGGTELTTTITEGYNKIEITTPNNSTNLLTIDGQGIKISKVVVSEALCSGYYKGLQSCFEEHKENGKYVCVIRGISLDGNKVNGIKFYLNEPLRGIGNIKDRLCIKDGKLMVERNCGSATFGGSEDENWLPTGYGGHATRNTFEINLVNTNGYKGVVPSISNLFINEQVADIPINDNAFRVYTNAQNITYFLFTPSTDIIPYRDIDKWKKYLQQNPITVVYQLATPVYEEVTNEYGLPIILEGYENGIVYVDSSVTPTTSIKYTSNNKVPATLSNVDNLNTTTQNDINNNIVTYMMDIDMMLTEMEMDDSASSVMSLSDSDDNNQNHDGSHSNILDRMNKEDRIKYQDNTTKMLEKVIKGKSLTKEENINRIDLYLSEGKIRKEQSNYLKELLKGVE